MNRINIDRILVVKNDNLNILFLDEVLIKAEETLLNKMKELSTRGSNNLFALHHLFGDWRKKHYIGDEEKRFNYCIPHEYSDSFINPIELPEIFTVTQYREFCDTMMADCIICAENNIDKNYCSKEKSREQKVKETADTYFNNRMKREKEKFCDNCCRFILSYKYHWAKKKLSKDPSVRMYSSETIGWTTFEHTVSDDFTILMKTNFCYGRVAYLKLWIRYKDVEILPYSSLVNYYYANMTDLIRYTKSFSPRRENWLAAMTFTIDAGNLSKTDPEAFIQKYILHEIETMITELGEIASNPSFVMQRFINKPNSDANIYVSVRNINTEESADYNVYQKEMLLAFKAEKITGALLFLENLKKLQDLKVAVAESISRIISMNIDFVPELEEGIMAVKFDISERRERLESESTKLVALDDRIKKYDDEYSNEKDKMARQNMKSEPQIEYLTRIHASYPKVLSDYQEQMKIVAQIKKDLDKRCVFANNLMRCLERVSSTPELRIDLK